MRATAPHRRNGRRAAQAKRHLVVLALISLSMGAAPLAAVDKKPYDDKLMRLSEILGAVHYLRELCGSGDGQRWREQMRELMNAEGSSALRRATLTRKFNQGYRSYARTYNSCTPSAKTAVDRFIVEGVELAEGMVKAVP